MAKAGELSSWSDGAATSAIVDFVARVTKEGGNDYVAPAERIATFDNDGTLWCEQPMQVQFLFLVDRVKELAAKDKSLAARQPFKAVLERDLKTLQALGMKGLQELFAETHSGMTVDEFESIVNVWFGSAKHPKLKRAFTRVAYRPQVELLEYLRANGFRTFIVSGGGVDFMRVISEELYGIEREQVVGSSSKLEFDVERGVLTKLRDLQSFDDRETKVLNIGLHIGRRPILAFGNSDGDLAMLRYTLAGPGARLALLLHHDDAEREFAYDRDFKLSPLVEALDKAKQYGITLVSMKNDWRSVFE
jgi:phosphoserine phosphatase